jgi:hypothetical protein
MKEIPIVQLQIETMARTNKTKSYKGPKKTLAAMSCYTSCPKAPAKINKYLYSWHYQADGRNIKRRTLNPAYKL